jgi:hypothetical protein
MPELQRLAAAPTLRHPTTGRTWIRRTVDTPQVGAYRAVLRLPGGEMASSPQYFPDTRTRCATMHRDRIEGSVTLIKAGGQEQVIPFTMKARRRRRLCCRGNSTTA